MENKQIGDYFSSKSTEFWSLLKTTQKWKELYNQRESKIAFITDAFILIILCFAFGKTEFDSYMELLKNLMQIAINTSVGMLGFIISGLAIFTGTITTRLIKKIDSERKINSLIGILFSFFFIGAVIGIGIVIYIVTFILLNTDLMFTMLRLIVLGSICLYFYLYSIFYSISLLGTCLRLFFISYMYSK